MDLAAKKNAEYYTSPAKLPTISTGSQKISQPSESDQRSDRVLFHAGKNDLNQRLQKSVPNKLPGKSVSTDKQSLNSPSGGLSLLKLKAHAATPIIAGQKLAKSFSLTPPAIDKKQISPGSSPGGLALLQSRNSIIFKDRSNIPSKNINPKVKRQQSNRLVGGYVKEQVAPKSDGDDKKKPFVDGDFKIPMQIATIKKRKLQDLELKIFYNVDIKHIDFGKDPLVLGRGGQGYVKKGTWLNQQCSGKEVSAIGDNIAALKEIELLSSVTHTNVVKLLSVAPEPTKLHLIFEFIDGYNFREVIFCNALQISMLDKRYTAIKTCNVIRYLHQSYEGKPTILHADIKPANILIGKQRLANNLVVKVCDFGLSKFKDMDTLRNSGIAGTFSYMAPEQLLNFQQPSKHTDIWSLACTFKELYTKNISSLPHSI